MCSWTRDVDEHEWKRDENRAKAEANVCVCASEMRGLARQKLRNG